MVCRIEIPIQMTRPTTLRNRPSFHLLSHSSNLSRHFRQGLLDTAVPIQINPGKTVAGAAVSSRP
jgi:hypothetical protein